MLCVRVSVTLCGPMGSRPAAAYGITRVRGCNVQYNIECFTERNSVLNSEIVSKICCSVHSIEHYNVQHSTMYSTLHCILQYSILYCTVHCTVQNIQCTVQQITVCTMYNTIYCTAQ